MIRAIIALLAFASFSQISEAGELRLNLEKTNSVMSLWHNASAQMTTPTAGCTKVGGTNSAPVCGGSCPGGQQCDIAIGGDGRSYCECS